MDQRFFFSGMWDYTFLREMDTDALFLGFYLNYCPALGNISSYIKENMIVLPSNALNLYAQ